MSTTSRRDFIVEAGATLGALSVAPGLVRADDPVEKMPPFIDAHVHVWTPDTGAYPTAAGMDKSKVEPQSFTPEELLAQAKPCGVGRVVLIQMSFYRFVNAYMLDAIRRFPGVFSGVAVVDHGHPHVAGRMKELATQGVRGFRLAVGDAKPEEYFAQPGIDLMWKTGAETGLKMCLLINPNALATVDEMCKKHPETPVVIDHFARVGIDGEIREAELDQLCQLARHPKVHVKVSAYYALGAKKSPYTDLLPMIKRLLGAYTADRLMWATDCPFQVQNGHTYQDSVDLIAKHADFLTHVQRKKLLHDTAERVFFA